MIYPPYCDIALAGFLGINEEKVHATAVKFFLSLTKKIKTKYKDEKVIVVGPMPARVAKVSNKFRYRLIIKCRNTQNFRKLLAEVLEEIYAESSSKSVSVYIDLNPENIL